MDFLSLNKEPRGKYLEQDWAQDWACARARARAWAWAKDWARAWAEAWTQAQAHFPGLHLRLVIGKATVGFFHGLDSAKP